ncbi:hypothetical protein RND71_021848 [Anisodus tanguticus]|uniref:Uncharacterized protein n=1 Tax=Anisodus tanguticus TaxID=243964 RepID=A0AAE1VFM3_9SOLA|nr:hypothetical protein RND71_021848 [Anisodus tanguticus]
MVAKTWRPGSSQSWSTKGVLGDEKHDFGGQVQEIKCTVSSFESTVLAEDSEAEVVNDVVDTSQNNELPKAMQVSEGIDLEEQTTPSATGEPLSAS